LILVGSASAKNRLFSVVPVCTNLTTAGYATKSERPLPQIILAALPVQGGFSIIIGTVGGGMQIDSQIGKLGHLLKVTTPSQSRFCETDASGAVK